MPTYRLYIAYMQRGSFLINHARFEALDFNQAVIQITAHHAKYFLISVQFYENQIP